MDDLKRMGRGELLEIIYQMRRALDEKDAALTDCRRQLAEKRALDEQNVLTEAMKGELRAAVDALRADVSEPMRAQINALMSERDALKNALDARNAAWTSAGSLAEAVVAVNGLMEDAQRAADQYLADVKESERTAAAIVEKARAEAAEITEKARAEVEALRAQGERENTERMKAFREACRALIEQQEALRGLLKENEQ